MIVTFVDTVWPRYEACMVTVPTELAVTNPAVLTEAIEEAGVIDQLLIEVTICVELSV